MRRVMLLALVALALPMASLADTIGFKFDTCPSGCTTLTGTVAPPSSSPVYTLTGNGVTFTIDFTDVMCPNILCSFGGGSVTVTNSVTGAVLLMDSFTEPNNTGRIIRTESSNVISDVFDSIDLTPNIGIGQTAFGTLSGAVDWNTTFGAVISGRVTAIGATNVPEPGTLGLLGTGLIGLAVMTIRKLKLGT